MTKKKRLRKEKNLLSKNNIQKLNLLENYTRSKHWKYMSPSQRSLYKQYRRNAEVRNKEFRIGLLHFCNLTSSNCFYCGTSPKQKKGSMLYNGIDRVDNGVGYQIGNVISCCGKCNKAKGTMSFSDFQDWIHNLSEEYKLRKCELSKTFIEVEYFVSRGLQVNPNLYNINASKLNKFKKYTHKVPDFEHKEFLKELITTKTEY